MTDGIIKGSGNSRYLRSVANALSLYPTYTSFIQALAAGTFPIDLNGLNANGWSQQGTKLAKAALLKDATAALYGKSASAVPDDILAFIGQYNKYWWKRRAIQKGASRSIYICVTSQNNSYGQSCKYSSTIKIGGTKEPEMAEPTSSVVAYFSSAVSVLNVLVGKYFHGFIEKSDIGGNRYYSAYYGVGSVKKTIENTAAYFSMNAQKVTLGEPDYVSSSDANAYPESGVVGDYYYEAIGKPLEFFDYERSVVFNYRGTGTYGINNPTVLTFPFDPNLVIVSRISSNFSPVDSSSSLYIAGWRQGFIWVRGMSGTNSAGKLVSITSEEKTLKFWSDTAEAQSNDTSKYCVTAFR
ncbi:MAG: hypothetical protein HFG05_03895 [Oscillibacter sp.]|nr:hypothetical protein [Oscillibacter sp.]